MLQEHFISTSDQESWNKYLPASRSVFGSWGFARVCERFRGYAPRLYVLDAGDASITYPVFLRPIAGLPFSVPAEAKWDTVSPDYTGPRMQGNNPELAQAYAPKCCTLFREQGVVAEFAHLHPWHEAATLLPGDGRKYNREIVWVDVSLDPDHLWREHLEYSVRKNVKRAEKEGVRFFEGTTDDHIREYHRVYCKTMQRNHALESYYFPVEYFQLFREELPDNARFLMAEYKDRIVAATLYLHDDEDVFGYLGGADAEFKHVSATNASHWSTIQWAHAAGKKRLILGGGYKPDDGVFKFKAALSPLRRSFHVYRHIHMQQEYELLDQRCREHYGVPRETLRYFPSYRYFRSPDAPI